MRVASSTALMKHSSEPPAGMGREAFCKDAVAPPGMAVNAVAPTTCPNSRRVISVFMTVGIIDGLRSRSSSGGLEATRRRQADDVLDRNDQRLRFERLPQQTGNVVEVQVLDISVRDDHDGDVAGVRIRFECAQNLEAIRPVLRQVQDDGG